MIQLLRMDQLSAVVALRAELLLRHQALDDAQENPLALFLAGA